jgi:hypothetical protein
MLPKLARLFNRRGHKLEMRGPPAAATADNVSCALRTSRSVLECVQSSGAFEGGVVALGRRKKAADDYEKPEGRSSASSFGGFGGRNALTEYSGTSYAGNMLGRMPNQRWLMMRASAFLVVLVYLAVSFVAVSPQLHHAVEGHGAGSPQDQCAATLMANGLVEFIPPVVMLPERPVVSFAAPVSLLSVHLDIPQRFPDNRAPPLHC